jgi:hypothetical protein
LAPPLKLPELADDESLLPDEKPPLLDEKSPLPDDAAQADSKTQQTARIVIPNRFIDPPF